MKPKPDVNSRILHIVSLLATQVYKWALAKNILILQWTSIPFKGNNNTIHCFMLQNLALGLAKDYPYYWGGICCCNNRLP